MKRQEILKLNASFAPIGTSNWKDIMVQICSGAVHPVDVSYETDEHGNLDQSKVEWLNVVKSLDEWAKLPIREYDEYVNTAHKSFRLPSIVVCSKFNKIIHKRVVFPTKANIWSRDNYTCQYTGEKLSRDEISVDHILPVSRGGQNTWENLVTASKKINVWKSNRTPQECGLKLLSKPTKPRNGMIVDLCRPEWQIFLSEGKYEAA